jgi:hypothetical protein
MLSTVVDNSNISLIIITYIKNLVLNPALFLIFNGNIFSIKFNKSTLSNFKIYFNYISIIFSYKINALNILILRMAFYYRKLSNNQK